MAKRNQKTGHLSGKISNVVIYTWKNIEVIRAIGLKRDRQPTEAQRAHREKFALASALNRKFSSVRRWSFAAEEGQTDASLAQHFIMAAIEGESPGWHINFQKVQWSRGTLEKPSDVRVSIVEPGIIHFQWKADRCIMKGAPADRVFLIAFSENEDYPYFEPTAARRFDGEANLPVSRGPGKVYHTWILFRSEEGKLRSDSVYGGAVSL